MTFRSRMDAAYGRRGGGFSEFPQAPRPRLGANTLARPTLNGASVPVVVLEHLSARRSSVRFVSNGAEMICADSWLEADR